MYTCKLHDTYIFEALYKNVFYHNPILCYFAKHMFDSITRMRVYVKVATQRVRASLI